MENSQTVGRRKEATARITLTPGDGTIIINGKTLEQYFPLKVMQNIVLQPFAVLVLGLLLGPRMAFATLAAYLAEGAMGLPVFAPGPTGLSGLAHLFGPTGGYLMAYPVAVALIAVLWRRSNRNFGWGLVSTAAGDALILATGAVWLALWTHGSATTVFTQAVLPFLPGEALKIATAAGVGAGASRIRRAN